MSNKLILFGLGRATDVLLYFFSHHSDFEVVAITVNRDYLAQEIYEGLPVVPFETIEEKYPPVSYRMFVVMGYADLNRARQVKIEEARNKGYEMVSYVHPNSGVPNDLVVGENCFIMNDVHIHPKVVIGDDVFIWSGSIICHHSSIGDHCWFTSGASIAGGVKIGNNGFFAINTTITNDVTIGDRCLVGANALVNKNLPDDTVVIAPSTKQYPLSSEDFLKLKNGAI